MTQETTEQRSPTWAMTAVADTWFSLSGRRPDPDTDFFEAGGTSLLAARLLTRLMRSTGIEVALGDFLACPSAIGLAELLAAAPRQTMLDKTIGPMTAPLTLTQQRIWVADQLAGSPSPYVLGFLAHLPAGVTDTAVAEAVHQLNDRHPALRCTVDFGESGDLEMRVTEAELAILTQPDGVNAAAWMRQLVSGIDGLDDGPPVCWGLATDGVGRCLVLIAHHVILDGQSWHILLAELASLLSGQDLPAAPPSFLEYADQWDRQRVTSRDEPAPSTTAPVTSLAIHADRAQRVVLRIGHDTMSRLRRRSGGSGSATEYMGLLTCIAAATSPVSGMVSAVVSERAQRFAETVGCFVRVVEVPAQVAAHTFDEAVAQVRDGLIAGLGMHPGELLAGSDVVVNQLEDEESGLPYQELAPEFAKYRLRIDIRRAPDGVCFVVLESAEDPRPVASTLARALTVWPGACASWATVNAQPVLPGDLHPDVSVVEPAAVLLVD